MALSVDAGFGELIETIRAKQGEVESAAGHRASIDAKLRSVFGSTALFRTGSFGNGTNVAGYSDVDYFAVIPVENLKADSAITLDEVATALRDRFPFTDIRINGPAVKVPFGLDGAEATEIVPVHHTGFTKLGFRQFDMPDGKGGWKFSAPESHNAYVSAVDDKFSGKAKLLIRLLKAWKYYKNVPLKSFYLEIVTAAYASAEKAIVYQLDIPRVMRLLLQNGVTRVRDPRFPNDEMWLDPCATETQRKEIAEHLKRAVDWAEEAWVSEVANDMEEAFDRWDLVYNWEFPTYI
ncbi:nucleotidyltransferase [Granulicella sp. L46]|uniref:SMODS domain-containing nucleotidyltransferase n=1 Tax=Granulicella sp. L46 TaxID=1641865 RepID=UPI00131DF0F2|nr:nucleotidyltransferase [Granulicella sp. L46]